MRLILFTLFFSLSSQHVYAGFVCSDPDAFNDEIKSAAKSQKIDPLLIHAVIKQESCYDPKALSHAGAIGLMQLIPATAQRFNVDPYIGTQNIDGGTRYLAWLLKRYKGNIALALAGYNAGEGNVDKYKGIPPFRETRTYVKRVIGFYLASKKRKQQNIPDTKVPTGLEGLVSPAPEKRPTGLNISTLSVDRKPSKQLSTRKKSHSKPTHKATSLIAQQSITVDKQKRVRVRSLTLKRHSRSGYVRVKARQVKQKNARPSHAS